MSASRIYVFITTIILLAGCSDNSTQRSSMVPVPAPIVEGELIPRSAPEQANYFLINTESDGEYLQTVHSRVSSASHGYSLTRIDCALRRYQDLGYGEDRVSNIKLYDNVQWVEVVPSSSKSDLVTFACSRAL